MSGLSDLNILSSVIEKLYQHSDKNKVRVNDAISAISKAWTYTYDYLKNKNGEIIPNQHLSDLWNEAATKTRLVNYELADQLQDKSRFWIHPTIPRQKKILLLTEITDEVERLEMKFRK